MPTAPDDPRPPDLGAAGAAMREEWRAEQDATTRDAAEQWQHSRTLLDIAREFMHRGDRVAITVAGHRTVGVVIEVADDRIALLERERRTDIRVTDALPLMINVIEKARAGGRTGAPAANFRARLLELEMTGDRVVVATAVRPDPFIGVLTVGTDLVVIALAGDNEIVVALSAVAFVAPAD